MDELLSETEVRALCTLLEEHKGDDVIALDLRGLHSWTDFFIIATVSSGTHLQGLQRHISDYAIQKGFSVLRSCRRNDESGGWKLLDLGAAVIHLMTAQIREFYELEELWSSASRIYPAIDASKCDTYSSKSS
ncbi:MAG: ribosome silencing factor [Treponema sp.]|jgi:ribosome-associated protein|nr:ribosome silencing factor [Treponema sp.]